MAEQGMKKALKTSDLTVFGMMFMIPIAPMAWYGTLVGPALGMVSLGYVIALVAMRAPREPVDAHVLARPIELGLRQVDRRRARRPAASRVHGRGLWDDIR